MIADRRLFSNPLPAKWAPTCWTKALQDDKRRRKPEDEAEAEPREKAALMLLHRTDSGYESGEGPEPNDNEDSSIPLIGCLVHIMGIRLRYGD